VCVYQTTLTTLDVITIHVNFHVRKVLLFGVVWKVEIVKYGMIMCIIVHCVIFPM
jgi:hypothetical protein